MANYFNKIGQLTMECEAHKDEHTAIYKALKGVCTGDIPTNCFTFGPGAEQWSYVLPPPKDDGGGGDNDDIPADPPPDDPQGKKKDAVSENVKGKNRMQDLLKPPGDDKGQVAEPTAPEPEKVDD